MHDRHSRRIDALSAGIDPQGPGLALSVARHGATHYYERCVGVANLDYGVPITADTVFRVASLSKQFTGMSIALLELDGKLSASDDVRQFLPELPDYGAPITIDHLLRHTSGLQDFCHLLWAVAGRPFGDAFCEAELLDLICRQRELNFAPGDCHLYSNTGYFLLSVIVERVSGIKLAQFANERIFAPLGMSNTHFHDDNSLVVPNRAIGYTPDPNAACGYRISDMPTTMLVGDDGLFTTLNDLAIWARNFTTNALGGGQELIARTLAPGRLNNGEAVLYGYGHFLGQRRGLNRFWHYGEFLGFQSVIRRFPEQDTTIICLANSSAVSPTDLAVAIEDIILEDEFGPAPAADPEPPTRPAPSPPELTPAELAAYVGRYVNDELRVTYTIASDGRRLTMRNDDPHAVPVPPLTAVAGDEFETRLQQLWRRRLRFQRQAGCVVGFSISNHEERPTVFRKTDR
ncbi:MAG: serine hydrolase domain-containing protein [Chloroflexota bacterium]